MHHSRNAIVLRVCRICRTCQDQVQSRRDLWKRRLINCQSPLGCASILVFLGAQLVHSFAHTHCLVMITAFVNNIVVQVSTDRLIDKTKSSSTLCFESRVLLLLRHISGVAQGEDAHVSRLAIDIDDHALVKELKLLEGTDNIIEVATMRTQGNRQDIGPAISITKAESRGSLVKAHQRTIAISIQSKPIAEGNERNLDAFAATVPMNIPVLNEMS